MDLASLDTAYKAAEVKTAPDALPDGKYQVVVDQVELKTAGTGNPMLAFQLKVLAGAHAGRRIFKNSVITPNTLSFLKQDLTTLGWTQGLKELEDPLARRVLLDVQLEVTQKTKPGKDAASPNVNVYFNRRLDAGAVAAAVGADKPPF